MAPEVESVERARALAWRSLNKRDRTVDEVGGMLLGKRVEPAIADQVVTELIELGYLDDARYAERFAEDRRRLDGWGSDRIARSPASSSGSARRRSRPLVARPGTPRRSSGGAALELLALGAARSVAGHACSSETARWGILVRSRLRARAGARTRCAATPGGAGLRIRGPLASGRDLQVCAGRLRY